MKLISWLWAPIEDPVIAFIARIIIAVAAVGFTISLWGYSS